MEELLEALHKKGTQGELYRTRDLTTLIEFRSGALESVKSKQIDGQALRVIDNGRIGFSTTTDVDDPSGLIEAAISAAAFGEEAPFRFTDCVEGHSVDVYDEAVASIAEDQLIGIGRQVVEGIESADSRVEVNVSIARSLRQVEVENTSGLGRKEKRSALSLSIEVERASQGDLLVLGDEEHVRFLGALAPTELVGRLTQKLLWAERIVPTRSTRLPVMFTPRGSVALLLPLIAGLNGKAVYEGTSPLAGRINTGVLDARLSIVDDATHPGGPRSGSFDDEGTATRRTDLVTEGTLKSFVYDLRTAALAEAASTGNGYKRGMMGGGFRSPAGVSMSNVLVEAGTGAAERVLEGIKEGLVVEDVLGLGQGNLASGEFSNNVAVGFKVENGEIVGRVKNTMIAGNSYKLLEDGLVELCSDSRWVHGMLNVPSICVDGVSVVGESA